jgi:hypothetical protein
MHCGSSAGFIAAQLDFANPHTTTRPFEHRDKSVRPPTGVTYVHWGTIGINTEPNNGTGFEICGMANASLTYNDAWGWVDVQCGLKAIFMCKLQRG